MATLIEAQDIIRVSGIENRQLREFGLNGADPREEQPRAALAGTSGGIAHNDLGIVLAGWKTAGAATQGPIGRNADAGFDHCHRLLSDCLDHHKHLTYGFHYTTGSN